MLEEGRQAIDKGRGREPGQAISTRLTFTVVSSGVQRRLTIAGAREGRFGGHLRVARPSFDGNGLGASHGDSWRRRKTGAFLCFATGQSYRRGGCVLVASSSCWFCSHVVEAGVVPSPAPSFPAHVGGVCDVGALWWSVEAGRGCLKSTFLAMVYTSQQNGRGPK